MPEYNAIIYFIPYLQKEITNSGNYKSLLRVIEGVENGMFTKTFLKM